MRCAVVGHVEWVEFARVPRLPAAGTIVHADDSWAEPAGAGPVMARQLALLAGRCELFTVLGDDELGHSSARRLAEVGIDVHAEYRAATRRAWTHIDAEGERTITVIGDKLLPRPPLPLGGYDAIYFVAGEPGALREARSARFLAATAREQATLREADVHVELLVGSLNDPSEHYEGGVDAGVVVLTDGRNGSTANGERFPPAPVPGPIVDTYGAGDSFAAALCFALARGDDLPDAIALASRAGAAVIAGRGPFSTQLALTE